MPDNVVSKNAARYTLVKRNGKPVHGNKREIIKICVEESVDTIHDRVTGAPIKVDLAAKKFAVT